MNKISLTATINNASVDLTPFVTLPITVGDLLDEQLDEISVTLKHCDLPYIEQMTVMNLTVTTDSECVYSLEQVEDIISRSDYNLTAIGDNVWTTSGGEKAITVTHNDDNTITVESVVSMICANDTAIENPVGSGRYTHELYLIEYTKVAEGFIGDSCTFTNSLGAAYAKIVGSFVDYDVYPNKEYSTTELVTSNYYRSPVGYKGLELVIVAQNIVDFGEYSLINSNVLRPMVVAGTQGVYFAGLSLARLYTGGDSGKYIQQLIIYQKTATGRTAVKTVQLYYIVPSASSDYNDYTKYQICRKTTVGTDITYEYAQAFTGTTSASEFIPNGALSIGNTTATINSEYGYEVEYEFLWTSEDLIIYPVGSARVSIGFVDASDDIPELKKWTITEVVNRLCDIIEPISTDETPRFTLNAEQAEKYENIYAPEFSFTKMTFREQLQQVGGFIHAEPRLKNENGQKEIWFDEYGEQTQSNISDMPYIASGFKTDINDYCTSIDSSAENLINQLDYAQGVVFEPFQNGYIGLRSESSTGQLKDDTSSYIPTKLPIYKLVAVYVWYNSERYDLTPYIFEEADYNSLLKTYNGTFPYSKKYALYYTQGSKNIQGLFFIEDVDYGVGEYAINQILSKITLTSVSLELADILNLGFEIEYIPLYSTRIKTSKQTVSLGIPRTISYNQNENTIETRYYSNHLLGAVERLGNVEKNYTYILANYTDIPKVGYLFDDNYYISTVTTEIQAKFFKCTVGLSKNFNRLSEYIGVSSNKRMWEVSEKQSVSRQSIFQDFLAFSFSPFTESTGRIFKLNLLTWFISDSKNDSNYPVSLVKCQGTNGTEIKEWSLSAVSSAIGTSLVITAEVEDNYSAGKKIKIEGDSFYSDYVNYTNYYGSVNSIIFSLYRMRITDTSAIKDFPDYVPNSMGLIATTSDKILYRKDNREIPQFNFQLTAVTGTNENDNKLIFGTGLMKNSTLVTTRVKKCVCYLLKDKLARVTSKTLPDFTTVASVAFTVYTDYIKFTQPTSTVEYKSWAIFTESGTDKIQVADENGNIVEQTIPTGGELVLGANIELPEKLYATILKRNPSDTL